MGHRALDPIGARPCATAFNDHIGDTVDHISVVATTTAHGVVARTCVKRVIAVTARQNIIARATQKRVIAGVARQTVSTAIAGDHVVNRIAGAVDVGSA